MAQNAPNEVEETIKQLKLKSGFHAYIIMNNDGIVIKYENMEYTTAVMHAYHVLELYAKSKKKLQKLLAPPDNEVESLRLRTTSYEMIVAQYLHFTLVVLQLPTNGVVLGTSSKLEEGKEKEEEKIPS